MRQLRQRVSVKIGLAVATLVVLVAVGQWLVFRLTLELSGEEIRTRLVEPGVALAIASVRSEDPSAPLTREQREARLRATVGEIEGFCIALYDADGRLLARSRDDVSEAPSTLPASVRARADRTPERAISIGASRLDAPTEIVVAVPDAAGVAYLGLFERATAATLTAVRVRSLMIILVLLSIVALAATAMIAHRIRRRIQRAQRVVQRIADGSLGERLPAAGDDEVGVLVSDFNRMAERVEELVSTLRREEERKRSLFAAFTHEINTPLTSVLGYLESLRMPDVDADPETRRRYVVVAHEQAQALDALADDLQTLSRLEVEGLSLERAPHDLAAIALREVEALAQKAREAEVRVEVEGEPVVADVDPRRIGQVLRNLLDNAIRHSRAGGAVRVVVRRDERGEPSVAVRDEGEGIAEEHLARVFEPLFRVDPSRARATGGRGLGLAIAHGIALAHGGRLEIRSRAGEGTEARLELPRHAGE